MGVTDEAASRNRGGHLRQCDWCWLPPRGHRRTSHGIATADDRSRLWQRVRIIGENTTYGEPTKTLDAVCPGRRSRPSRQTLSTTGSPPCRSSCMTRPRASILRRGRPSRSSVGDLGQPARRAGLADGGCDRPRSATWQSRCASNDVPGQAQPGHVLGGRGGSSPLVARIGIFAECLRTPSSRRGCAPTPTTGATFGLGIALVHMREDSPTLPRAGRSRSAIDQYLRREVRRSSRRQRIVRRGPYRVLRHPSYAGLLVIVRRPGARVRKLGQRRRRAARAVSPGSSHAHLRRGTRAREARSAPTTTTMRARRRASSPAVRSWARPTPCAAPR